MSVGGDPTIRPVALRLRMPVRDQSWLRSRACAPANNRPQETSTVAATRVSLCRALLITPFDLGSQARRAHFTEGRSAIGKTTSNSPPRPHPNPPRPCRGRDKKRTSPLRAHSHERDPSERRQAQSEPRRSWEALVPTSRIRATCAVGSEKSIAERAIQIRGAPPTATWVQADRTSSSPRLRETRSKPASIETHVSERGLEPPRAISSLGPQPSASTNSATPTWTAPGVYI